MIAWSLRALRDAEVTDIVVAVPPGEASSLAAADPDVRVVAGGDRRQDSVAAALAEVDAPRVVVHDAARPLASASLFQRIAAALAEHDAVVCGVPLDETIKKVAGGVVAATIERDGLFRVQTPQGFDADLLRRAHEHASRTGFTGTDDAQLVEQTGANVVLVEGERTNIKITYDDDLALAEAIAARFA